MDIIEGIEGTEERIQNSEIGDEDRVGLMWSRLVARMKKTVLVKIDRVILGNELKW